MQSPCANVASCEISVEYGHADNEHGQENLPPTLGGKFAISNLHTPRLPTQVYAVKMKDPSIELPRDETGSYLHLKLKRFESIEVLSMAYAKKTWTKIPRDAEIDVAPSSRSSCRQCHLPIEKGVLRIRLWLQCHKGCKNSAYFH